METIYIDRDEPLTAALKWTDEDGNPLDLTGRSIEIIEAVPEVLYTATVTVTNAATGDASVSFGTGISQQLGRTSYMRFALTGVGTCIDTSPRLYVEVRNTVSFLEQNQRVTDADGVLMFLEIWANSLPERLRVVNDTQNWTSQGIEYVACPFGFKLPDDTAGQTPRAQLLIDNVGLGMTQDLEALAPNDMVMCRLIIASRSMPNVHDRVFNLPMTMASATTGQVTASLGVDHLMRTQSVAIRYTADKAPGIF